MSYPKHHFFASLVHNQTEHYENPIRTDSSIHMNTGQVMTKIMKGSGTQTQQYCAIFSLKQRD